MTTRSIPNQRLVFNLKDNDHRLICHVRYANPDQGFAGVVYVKFVGTHAEYDKIDPMEVEL